MTQSPAAHTVRRRLALLPSALARVALAAATAIAAALSSACTDPRCNYESPTCKAQHVCAFTTPNKSRCLPYAELPRDLPPPFHEGHPFWCSQGGRSPVGRTHSFAGDVFALDLASTSQGPVEVISPVAGTAYVFDDCEERDSTATARNSSSCGLGYGNHAKVWDGENVYLFAHLARALVEPGPVQEDAVLGVMGASGAAGERHVHVVVTRPAKGEDVEEVLRTPGWKGQVPVRYRLVAHDAETKARVREWSDELPCTEEQSRRTLLTR